LQKNKHLARLALISNTWKYIINYKPFEPYVTMNEIKYRPKLPNSVRPVTTMVSVLATEISTN